MQPYLLLPLSIVLLFAGISHGDDATEKAKAALALAKAQRERQAASTVVAKPMPKAVVIEGDCFEDLGTARLVAKKLKKPLVLWVGMTCQDAPDLCKAISDDCISCHVKDYHGSSTPRVIVPDGDTGAEYKVLKDELKTTPIAHVRSRMGLPVCDGDKCHLPKRELR